MHLHEVLHDDKKVCCAKIKPDYTLNEISWFLPLYCNFVDFIY